MYGWPEAELVERAPSAASGGHDRSKIRNWLRRERQFENCHDIVYNVRKWMELVFHFSYKYIFTDKECNYYLSPSNFASMWNFVRPFIPGLRIWNHREIICLQVDVEGLNYLRTDFVRKIPRNKRKKYFNIFKLNKPIH